MSSTPIAKLLIVDDEIAQMKALCNTLLDAGYATTGFTSGTAALEALRQQEFDLVLTDLMMPDMDGIALLHAAKEIDSNLVAIVMTGHGAVDTAVRAMKAGALDYIQKPFRLSSILPVLTRALVVRRLHTENIQLRQAVAIHQLTAVFTRELHWRAVIDKAVDAVFEQSENGNASAFVIADNRTELYIAAARGSLADQQRGQCMAFDREVKSWVASIREKLASPDEWQLSDFIVGAATNIIGNAISMPMLAGGNFVGIINLSFGNASRRITLGELKTLSSLAAAAGSAMEVALLVDQLHGANSELEQRVRSRTTDLEAANKELEAFSYSISHDLRAPLRAIDGFSAILMKDASLELSTQAKHAAGSIRLASQRMSELIEDLLELSRLSLQPLRKQRIDMRALAQQIVDELAPQHAERTIRIDIGDIPQCLGDESLLRQVFVNLLTNAFKFTRHCAQTHIEVGAQIQGDECVYFVRDNGAGFDMQYAEKLFGVFQRLHSNTQFEGTGIGLSIVHRIVARHGGRIWADAAVGAGATFSFSLPLHNEAALPKENSASDSLQPLHA